MSDTTQIEILGADLAALLMMTLATEFLISGGLPDLGELGKQVAGTFQDVIEDYVNEGLIESATDEARVIAEAMNVLYNRDTGVEE